ncbi:MAG: hypothetical protein RJA22_532 [Verrucomicrobiota bacterium]|jgi:hypothetical protein
MVQPLQVTQPRNAATAAGRAVVLLLLLLAAGPLPGAPADPGPFPPGAVWRIRLEIPSAGMEGLRGQPREFVSATFHEGSNLLQEVAVRLKGSLGSFRPVDDKPAFTIDFDRRADGRRWRGLARLQLNNSVEDESYLHERLGSELFRAAGVPAPRVAHAVVELNGRRLGLYVLKEAFDPVFLARHFPRADGALFESDPGHGRDVDEAMPARGDEAARAAGDAARRRLVAAAREPDAQRRWEALAPVLDRERFVSFLAMEILLAHRDGYGTARNNFRVYHDPAGDRLVFLPDGLDQLVGRGSWPIQPEMGGLVARAVLETSAGRAACRERLGVLFTNLWQADVLSNRVQAWAAPLAAALPPGEARALRAAALDLGLRLHLRAQDATRQLALPPPVPLAFTNGVAPLAHWRAVDIPAGGSLAIDPAPDGRPALRILAGPVTSASWRTRAWLGPGRYRLEARARTAGVQPLPHGRTQGAFLAVSGQAQPQRRALTGDTDWTELAVEFRVEERGAEVELLCTLRAAGGQAWFDLASLRLVRQ